MLALSSLAKLQKPSRQKWLKASPASVNVLSRRLHEANSSSQMRPKLTFQTKCFLFKIGSQATSSGMVLTAYYITGHPLPSHLIVFHRLDMSCYVPFNNRNLDTCFFLFRPTVAVVDDLLDALKQFSLYTETLGCVHSCLFKSIHGSLIIWYGAWIKRSDESRELLNANLMSVLESISDLAILIDNNFFEAYAGESKDTSPVAVISTGNIVSLNGAVPYEKGMENLSYAFLALFRSCFSHIEGIRAGVCLKSSPSKPRVVCLNVWDSLQACYSWILNSDSRSKLQPFVDHLSVDIKYDIFKVVFVSSDAEMRYQFLPWKMLENGEVQGEDCTAEMRR